MKANELRIGNKIQKSNGEIFTVLRLDILVQEQRSLFTLNYNLFGIPLTEEILLKCGFKKLKIKTAIKNFFIISYKKNDFVVYLLSDFFEVELIIKDGEQFNLFKTFNKELHILQNLYFALTNEELIANL